MCPHPRAILLARKGLSQLHTLLKPRPREELRDLTPLARVLAQLDALDLDCQPSYPGYSASCPVHRGEKRNFDVIELDSPRSKRDGSNFPAGTVLIHCQAYGDSRAPDGCSQERLIEALGLWWCDLFPDGGGTRAPRRPVGCEWPLDGPLPEPPLSDDAVEEWTVRAASFRDELDYPTLSARLSHLVNQLIGDARHFEDAMFDALVSFEVGWRRRDQRMVEGGMVAGQFWTMPERDGRERITGINRRYEDGEKRRMSRSRRGLYVPQGWRSMPGPIFCPEGLSDAAMLVATGCCAIGRPSVRGGVDLLAELLRSDPRPIVILGENDDRPLLRDGSPVIEQGQAVLYSPGRQGAIDVYRKLRRALPSAEITIRTPPAPFKDYRDYLTGGTSR
jgi:hypothetical protein